MLRHKIKISKTNLFNNNNDRSLFVLREFLIHIENMKTINTTLEFLPDECLFFIFSKNDTVLKAILSVAEKFEIHCLEVFGEGLAIKPVYLLAIDNFMYKLRYLKTFTKQHVKIDFDPNKFVYKVFCDDIEKVFEFAHFDDTISKYVELHGKKMTIDITGTKC